MDGSVDISSWLVAISVLACTALTPLAIYLRRKANMRFLASAVVSAELGPTPITVQFYPSAGHHAIWLDFSCSGVDDVGLLLEVDVFQGETSLFSLASIVRFDAEGDASGIPFEDGTVALNSTSSSGPDWREVTQVLRVGKFLPRTAEQVTIIAKSQAFQQVQVSSMRLLVTPRLEP